MVKIQSELCFCERGMLLLGNLSGELPGQSVKGCKEYAVPCFPYRLLREQESLSDTLPASQHREVSTECWWQQSSSSREMMDGALWPLPAREWSWALHKGKHCLAKRGREAVTPTFVILPPVPTAARIPDAPCTWGLALQEQGVCTQVNTCFCSQSVVS